MGIPASRDSFCNSLTKGITKKLLNVKIRVSHFRYISTGLNCACVFLFAIYECLKIIKYPSESDFKVSMSLLIILLLFVIINLFRLLFLFPRRYCVFKGNKMYYHNGFKEICVNSVNNIIVLQFSFKVSYWYLLIKTGNKKRIFADILLFSKPESLIYMIRNINFLEEKNK